MLRAATEALLRAVPGQCRMQLAALTAEACIVSRPVVGDPVQEASPAGPSRPFWGRPAAAKALQLCMQGPCTQPVASVEWRGCSRSRIDSCCPAASGLLHCLQGGFRGPTAAWPRPSGMLFRQYICWTCLLHWEAWLWRPHRRGRCDQVGLQGQV